MLSTEYRSDTTTPGELLSTEANLGLLAPSWRTPDRRVASTWQQLLPGVDQVKCSTFFVILRIRLTAGNPSARKTFCTAFVERANIHIGTLVDNFRSSSVLDDSLFASMTNTKPLSMAVVYVILSKALSVVIVYAGCSCSQANCLTFPSTESRFRLCKMRCLQQRQPEIIARARENKRTDRSQANGERKARESDLKSGMQEARH